MYGVDDISLLLRRWRDMSKQAVFKSVYYRSVGNPVKDGKVLVMKRRHSYDEA